VTFQEWSANADPADQNSPEVVGPFNYYDKLDGQQNNHISSSVVGIIFNRLDEDGAYLLVDKMIE
jgi:hypothetical protein